jgi:hypothetical protein
MYVRVCARYGAHCVMRCAGTSGIVWVVATQTGPTPETA